jgi:hypothetical protein
MTPGPDEPGLRKIKSAILRTPLDSGIPTGGQPAQERGSRQI